MITAASRASKVRWSFGVALAVGGAMVLAPLVPSPAHAAPSEGYAEWQVEGGSGAFTGSVGLPTGFPDVTFESDSLASGTMIPSGASTWIPESTTFGSEFGSSRDQPYISLRPAGNRAGASSTTTYTFAGPTPVGGWGFSLGDIDAEILTVTAVDASGEPVPAEQLNLVEAYNYCGQTGSPSCPTPPPDYNSPDVSSTASSVVLQEPGCPASQGLCDTAGSSAWFMPDVPLQSLTISAEWKSGFPTYQTWFATAANALSGTVAADCVATDALSVQLLDADGAEVARTPVAADGSYGFTQVAARSDYSVRVDPATLAAGATSPTVPVDLSTDVADADLNVTSAFTATGSVMGETSLEGIPATLSRVDGSAPDATTETDDAGVYVFEGLTGGEYDVAVDAPEDTEVEPDSQSFTVDCSDIAVDPFALTPVDPTDPPVDPTDPPVDPTDPPVDPTDPPVDPTNPPVNPDDPTDPPTNPGDPGDSGPGGTAPLPATGSDFIAAPLMGGALLMLGGGLALTLIGRGRKQSRASLRG